MGKTILSLGLGLILLGLISGVCSAQNQYLQTNLVSDKNTAARAPANDLNLLNPWGITSIAGGPFWISDNGSGFSSLYDGTGKANRYCRKW